MHTLYDRNIHHARIGIGIFECQPKGDAHSLLKGISKDILLDLDAA